MEGDITHMSNEVHIMNIFAENASGKISQTGAIESVGL